MTFIVGLMCTDGIVVCTDSLEDDGITKKTVDKIRLVGTTAWGVALAASGSGSIIEKFYDHVSSEIRAFTAFDHRTLETTVEDSLRKFRKRYRKSRFETVVAAYSTSSRYLYLSEAGVLSPSREDCQTGMGNELWRLVADTLYTHRNTVADNLRVAIFATRLAIKYASGVDAPIQAVSYTFGDLMWRHYGRKEISAIESELPIDDFQEAIREFWRLHNPPTNEEQLKKYRAVRTPGDELTLLDGVKLEELYTVAGRRRASKIFRRNTGKLQQRAILEGKRYREAHPRALPSSDGKNRT